MEKLNCESLMIGDWVSMKDYPMKPGLTKIKPEHFIRSLVEFEPVLLTPEILEKNGFVKRSDRNDKLGKMEYYQLEDYGFVYHYSNGEWEFSLQNTQDHRLFSGYLNYVHELQHVLNILNIEKEIKL